MRATVLFATCAIVVQAGTFWSPQRQCSYRPEGETQQRLRPPKADAFHHELNPKPEPNFPRRPGHPSTGFIALGDSYSAGIGTGFNGTEDACRRGLHAHPMLIHEDLVNIEGENKTSFEFLSCTGSTISDLLRDGESGQIAEFNTTTSADFALLSIGGNDLGFFDIMNSCIFRFYSFYSGTCEEALARSDERIASRDFEHELQLAITEVLDRVHWEKRPWFTITVTGYARFFNEDTAECDDHSLGVWWRGPKLKRALRRRMNQMVLRVNDKIRQSVDTVNAAFAEPKVLFVDYDHAFEGHRFCEPDVTEPDYSRNETWFFLVGGKDNVEDQDGTPIDLASSTREAGLAQLPTPWANTKPCSRAARASVKRQRDALCRETVNTDGIHAEDMRYVPTSYGQTFHPRTKGHEAIRDEIYRQWGGAFDGR
ncbi:esterase [Emericellopsis atlantica]|uniref:Esterase n=1 Tax=Emericellopsis atlantica TaxID=2614577 RepID=A0A9P8CQE0_9HYPO|nr:esterase [Emericellopsis atlantica]KAG9255207.1 esterase [Emericellopsis atlantica]